MFYDKMWNAIKDLDFHKQKDLEEGEKIPVEIKTAQAGGYQLTHEETRLLEELNYRIYRGRNPKKYFKKKRKDDD